MNTSSPLWFPAGRYFNDGQITFAVILLVLQASIVFWPLAIAMARRHMERIGVERLLAELAETHRPIAAVDLPRKSFRKAA